MNDVLMIDACFISVHITEKRLFIF